jgi:hypothetical protein
MIRALQQVEVHTKDPVALIADQVTLTPEQMRRAVRYYAEY